MWRALIEIEESELEHIHAIKVNLNENVLRFFEIEVINERYLPLDFYSRKRVYFLKIVAKYNNISEEEIKRIENYFANKIKEIRGKKPICQCYNTGWLP